MMKEMKGVCFLFSETGTEGGWWAMQEDRFVTEDGHWSYEGLQYLKTGMTSRFMLTTVACFFMASFTSSSQRTKPSLAELSILETLHQLPSPFVIESVIRTNLPRTSVATMSLSVDISA
jgi:hypothetical protein